MKKWLQWGMGTILWCTACHSIQKEKAMSTEELKKEAVDTLRSILQHQQTWIKAHAAEFLIWTGHPEGVKEVYTKELAQFEDVSEYRIGIWRVLTQLSLGSEQNDYKNRILHAFLDTTGKDRIHAAETMGKLKFSPYTFDSTITMAALISNNLALQGYTNWAMSYTNAEAMTYARSYFFNNVINPKKDLLLRKISAYVLRYMDAPDATTWNSIADTGLTMSDEMDGRLNFLTTALILADEQDTKNERYQLVRNALLADTTSRLKAVRIEIANALAIKGTDADLPLLKGWMRNESPLGVPEEDADVRASSAYAVLKICERISIND